MKRQKSSSFMVIKHCINIFIRGAAIKLLDQDDQICITHTHIESSDGRTTRAVC
jgi:hypothetical protein